MIWKVFKHNLGATIGNSRIKLWQYLITMGAVGLGLCFVIASYF